MAAPGRRIPFLPQPDVESEEHLEALLDDLPAVEPKPPLPFVPADLPTEGGASDADLALFLDTLQAETQVFVAAQFSRLQGQLAERSPASTELDEARAMVAALREENARLLRQLDLFERAFENLKALTSDVEAASR